MKDTRVHLSVMSGKLAGLVGINTNTLANAYCSSRAASNTVCAHCYSRKMLSTFRASCVPAFQRNSSLLAAPLAESAMPKIKAGSVVRYNAHGELISVTHYENLCRVAAANPESVFTLWTKRLDIVDKERAAARPSNMILIFSGSSLDALAPIPEGFDHSFSVYEGERPPENAGSVFWCSKESCLRCRACYNPNLRGLKIAESLK